MFLQDHLPVFFICLSAFVCSVWSNSSKVNDSCVQRTENGHCCKFPFNHKKTRYYSCTKDDSGLFFGFIRSYFWCYYDQKDTKSDKCKEPIYHPTPSPFTESPTDKTTLLLPSSPSLNVRATPVLVFKIPSHDVVVHSSGLTVLPSSLSTTVLARSESGKGSSKKKQKMYIVLACGIGGGIILVILIALTIMIYLKRKNRMKVKRKEEADQHEMNSYRLTDESNNPVYESIDKDLDIKSNEEQQALQPGHVYQELEDPQSPTSCTHEYSTPYDASMSNSDGPKVTPALNDTDSFTHFNELYETN